MAIAGLHSVSALESLILRESRSSSSGEHDNPRMSGTRASSILQMWRELEDECVVSHTHGRVRLRVQRQNSDGLSIGAMTSNLSQGQETEGAGGLDDLNVSESGDGITSEGQIGPQSEHEDHRSITSEQSHDIGEVEREHVRQIIREWMNCGVTGCRSNVSNGSNFPNPRSQWLCEPELERVRVVREWIQMNSQQSDALGRNREEQVTEIESQIERVRDGLVLHPNEGQPESTRRDIRKLCGRQALLDLLAKKEQERQRELQGLLESRPVSSFAFRNRIQSSLRIRLLQNKTLVQHSRPISAAAGELGLLQQRHTVTGLREGFLSRLDNYAHCQAGDFSDSSFNSGANGFRDFETQANNSTEVLDDPHEQIDYVNQEGDIGASLDRTLDMVGSSIDEERNLVGSAGTQVERRLEHAFDNGAGNIEEPANNEFDRRNVHGDDNESWQIICQESSAHESGNDSRLSGSAEVLVNQYDLGGEEHEVPDASSQSDNSLSSGSDHLHGQESTINVEDLLEVTGDDEREWEGSVLSNEWGDGARIEMDGRNWEGTGHELLYNTLENEGQEQNHLQEAFWNETGSQEEAMGDWLEGHSGPRVTSAARLGTYYFPDDDNMYNTELRELLNRRRVSSLLHSGFRESLDQLIQSYVERQSQAPEEWELQEMPPSFALHDQEQLSTDQNEDLSTVEGPLPIQPSTTVTPQQHWNQELPQRTWSRHCTHQHPGSELEVINDLRIDMARLQQRLNNMQRMLEACMDMQLELQRSVRQEVSAALNRSLGLSEAAEDAMLKDGSKWDYVRKGICCVCCDSNIDSLLYRCGHMCTCTKCANVLVKGNGKCPMCRAPVMEVIRAYTIQ
ncbi:hypothetical protein Ancab_007689 [Ancistrocladus abbreviatus]